MAKSYTFYDMTSFPQMRVGQSLNTVFQRALIQGVEEPKTSFKLERKLKDLPIDVFQVKHEVIEFKIGRAKGVDFTEFVATYNFPAFYYKPLSLLMVRTKKDTGRGAVRTLVKDKSLGMEGNIKKLDLQSIQQNIEKFKGAWFHVADSADVSSQALFGPNIDQDIRFESALSEGEIFNIRLDYAIEDRVFHVGLSDDYSLVIFDNNLEENFELELVLSIKANLLDKAKVKESLNL